MKNMLKMHSVKIKDDLYKKICDFCSVNGLNITEYINNSLTVGLNIDQYGSIPFGVIERNIVKTADEPEQNCIEKNNEHNTDDNAETENNKKNTRNKRVLK